MSDRFVVHCKRAPFDVYIGRPSKWGNPFTVSEYGRVRALAEYSRWLSEPEQSALRTEAHEVLKGKVLGCWCAPNPCHGDILSRIANDTT